MTRRFTQADVFTAVPLLGNPVAVVHDADGLSDHQMAAVARWTNLSETTFLLPPSGPAADYRVRIFTTSGELPFAGHPTLGTAHAWLAAGGVPADDRVVVQECGVGLVEVRLGERPAFAAPPLIRSGPVDAADLDALVAAAGVAPDSVLDAAWADNGPGWVALELRSVRDVLAAVPVPGRTAGISWGLVARYDADDPARDGRDVEVRGFFDGGDGWFEDPVTGSLNAGLAQWLIGAGRLPTSYVAGQGQRVRRDGRVHVEQVGDRTWVGGDVVTVVQGEADLGGQVSGPLLVRPAARVLVVLALLLTGCSSSGPSGPSDSSGTDEGAQPGATASRTSAAPAPDRASELDRLTPVPGVRRPRALARRLRLLGSVLADSRADPAAVRRAAELEQVATRTLGQAPPATARAVLRLLPPRVRRKVAVDVSAARALSALAEPQPALPDWRIVAPPPADRLLRAYRAAERRTAVPWEHLAAIHLVETRMGRIRGVSTAGAQGPMQFLPSTWEIYGAGGDITDVEDAVMAAGRLLRANGAPGDMPGALFAYNQSGSYVHAVQSYAANVRRAPTAYRGYWHWRVLYRHTSGTQVLPVGYPRRPAVPLGRS